MFAILAALDQIDVEASMGTLPDVLEYKIDPLRLQEALPDDGQFASTFALADLFADGLVEPNLLLVEKVNTLIAESKQEIERYIAEYNDLYQENPPAFAEEIASVIDVLPDPIETKADPVELPGFESGPVKAVDWSIDMNDKGQLEVDSGGILPATEIDPRTSTYKSENETVQKALDVVAVVDQLASPIRTGIAEDAYNKTIEGLNDGR